VLRIALVLSALVVAQCRSGLDPGRIPADELPRALAGQRPAVEVELDEDVV